MVRRLRPFSSKPRRPFPPLRLTRLEDRLAPAMATWDGGGTDNNWTTAANWVGDVVPQPGDDLVFPAGAARLGSVNNLLEGTAFASIRITGPNYILNGNAISLASGITVNAALDNPPYLGDPQVNLGITLAAPQTFATSGGHGLSLGGSIDLNGHTLTASVALSYYQTRETNLAFAKPVRGAGGLVKEGGGSLHLEALNSYTGITDIRAGTVFVWTDTGLGATGAGNETTVGDNSLLFVGSFLNQPNQPKPTIAEAITFAAHPGNQVALQASDATFTGPLTLAGPNEFAGSFKITGTIGETGGSQDLTLFNGTYGSTAIVFAAGSVIGYTGRTIVMSGEVEFDSAPPGPVVVNGGTIGGSATIGPVTIGSGGAIAPGSFDFAPSATIQTIRGDLVLPGLGVTRLRIPNMLLDGSSDRLRVQGTVTLDGKLAAGTQFFGTPPPGSTPPAGTRYLILDNDGSDPIVGTFTNAPEGSLFGQIGQRYLRITYHGGDGNDVELVADAIMVPGRFAVGAGAGGLPIVNVYDGGGTLMLSLMAYDAGFRGGVRVTTADLTGDGIPDVITAPGPGGGPHVKVFDGLTGQVLAGFMAYDPAFRGGVFVAVGDFAGFGSLSIVTGAGPGGGPHVKFFPSGAVLAGDIFAYRSFFAYDASFRGGVTVAAGDTDGNNISNLITGPAASGPPLVRVFDVNTMRVMLEFNAYDPRFTGGVTVASDDIDRDHRADIVTGTGTGGVPLVEAFSGATGALLTAFYAYAPSFLGGVMVDAFDTNNDGFAEIVTGPGPGGGPHIRVFDRTGTVRYEWFAFDPAFTGGVFVG